jgi:Putative zincin peptidase
MGKRKMDAYSRYNHPIMPAHLNLPDGYTLACSIDLRNQPRLLLWLNLVGLGLLFLFAWLFFWLAVRLRLAVDSGLSSSNVPPAWWVTVVAILLAFAIVLLAHELVHGAFFWLITRSRPHFGLQITYAFAAAPEWYISRNPYLVVGLAPLVLITLAGVALLPLLPNALILPWVLALALNASGSVGDVYIIGYLLARPACTLVNDQGDSIHFYLPETP